MKKINLFLLGISMCILAALTSCNKESAKTPATTHGKSGHRRYDRGKWR